MMMTTYVHMHKSGSSWAGDSGGEEARRIMVQRTPRVGCQGKPQCMDKRWDGDHEEGGWLSFVCLCVFLSWPLGWEPAGIAVVLPSWPLPHSQKSHVPHYSFS